MVSGIIEDGELTPYTFVAQSGEGIQMRMAALSGNLAPWFIVYDPTGATVSTAYPKAGLLTTDASFAAPVLGTYTVEVGDGAYGPGGSGEYNLYFTKAPGSNEGGMLTPDVVVTETIDEADLDSYTFSACAGEGIQLRMGALSGNLAPQIIVYDSTGGVVVSVASGAGLHTTGTSFSAAESGSYTVVVGSGAYGAAGSGEYNLYFARAPGSNEGGLLIPDIVVTETIDEADLDSYTFSANLGEMLGLKMDTLSGNLAPQIVVYDSAGTIVKSVVARAGQQSVSTSFAAPSSGIHTVVVGDGSYGFGKSGEYSLVFEN
jgi:hypothetical protein